MKPTQDTLFKLEQILFLIGVSTYGVYDLFSTNIVFNAAGTFTENNILASGIYLTHGYTPLILLKLITIGLVLLTWSILRYKLATTPQNELGNLTQYYATGVLGLMALLGILSMITNTQVLLYISDKLNIPILELIIQYTHV